MELSIEILCEPNRLAVCTLCRAGLMSSAETITYMRRALAIEPSEKAARFNKRVEFYCGKLPTNPKRAFELITLAEAMIIGHYYTLEGLWEPPKQVFEVKDLNYQIKYWLLSPHGDPLNITSEEARDLNYLSFYLKA